jgi:hypothetical protein
VSNNTCGVFDGNGILQFELPLKGVENNNHGFIVWGEVPNDTGHAVHWDPNHNPTGELDQYTCGGFTATKAPNRSRM